MKMLLLIYICLKYKSPSAEVDFKIVNDAGNLIERMLKLS